jgi:hypothetical protein
MSRPQPTTCLVGSAACSNPPGTPPRTRVQCDDCGSTCCANCRLTIDGLRVCLECAERMTAPSQVVTDDDAQEIADWLTQPDACTECGGGVDCEPDCPNVVMPEPETPDEHGYYVWVNAIPGTEEYEAAIGMRAVSIRTRCRWTYRHIEEGLSGPQPCCYSVLIVTTRLPGEVRQERAWLTAVEPTVEDVVA